ncbi:asparagine synthase (glutamine-hydrolyzing) [Qipengyuania atrilutea]|uniref:asparagine synthase (glutamine-hydrolyzing) n=1 Tax=Qipengyuania atrilutea TaxID=2744473 RepID=A0A850H1B9_9SPHN|nr:asparagine synthase (glutamine-hydrolyzing) [Actirhodobacter atriluteus]NVD44397.1 asparagine synthase (glutamine-hydrolyzing) [Actirhodobacter atriluteus]
MCGIVGFIGVAQNNGALSATVEGMARQLAHRGPDDAGRWTDPRHGIALGHRRLSIIDLSGAGHQPMISRCQRYVTVYNGEIYNFKELKAELEKSGAINWSGHSDTEVMLEAVSRWGVRKTLPRLNGMFALSIWDRRERKLHLARDRFGEKPLFYGRCGKSFLFASELKALKAHPDFDPTIDRNALALFLRHNYVPGPFSIFEKVKKLDPGTHLEIDEGGSIVQQSQYWSMEQTVLRARAQGVREGDTVSRLNEILSKAVEQRMLADVPLGAFLSGGIDSSLIVALMQSISERPVNTFTIGFTSQGYNEADVAAAVAKHLGTNHEELYVTPKDALNLIPQIPEFWDEPFADSSQIPTFLVSRMTRRRVTVALSGDGGDELFGGYTRYILANRLFKNSRKLPTPIRNAAASILERPSTAIAAQAMVNKLPAKFRHQGLRDRLPKVARILSSEDISDVYRQLVSHFDNPSDLLIRGEEPPTYLSCGLSGELSNIEAMMLADTLTYLPDDILTKVDRASMAVSLETRVPFLDPQVVEFAWQIPLAEKVTGNSGKKILRRLLYRYVPQRIVDRPKMGFGIPIGDWLRGPLRSWADNLLEPRRLLEEGFFNPSAVTKIWERHCEGSGHHQYQIWTILMFQAWLEKHRSENVIPVIQHN